MTRGAETRAGPRRSAPFSIQIICDGASEGQAAISAGRLFHQANRGGTEGSSAHRSMAALLFSHPLARPPARWESPEVCLNLGESTTGGQVAISEQHP